MRSLTSSTRAFPFSMQTLRSRSCGTKECPDLFVAHLLAQIGLDHTGIIFDACGRSLRDLFTVLEHTHGLTRLHHHLQDMLDDDNGKSEAVLKGQYGLKQNVDIYG